MTTDNTIDFKTATRERAQAYFYDLNNAKNELKGDDREELEAFIKDEAARMRSELNEKTDDAYDSDALDYAQQLNSQAPAQTIEYKSSQRMEFTVDAMNSDGVVVMSRLEYAHQFRAHARNTARATLEMCRLVYSAHKTLSEQEFMIFCQSVGYKEDSSTIRKFITIGKVYPRLIDYADRLPVAWTSIYQLTQIPADEFQRCIDEGFAFNKLTGGELKTLIDKTKDANDIISPFKRDKKIQGFRVANVFFTKRPDDMDFRLLQKAFDEVASRLPVKLVIARDVIDRFDMRRQQRYEVLKQEAPDVTKTPQQWDFGIAANDVHKMRAAA